MRIRMLLIGSTLLAAGLAPAPLPQPDRSSDLVKMQGTWVVIRYEENGCPREGGFLVVFAGDKMTAGDPSHLGNHFVVQLSGRNRHALDLKSKSALNLCIYRFDGDTLTICVGGKTRPKNFKLGLKDGAIVVLKRQAPEQHKTP